jgi:aryl-alcohol dehydrogenase-like predicted oxidoreductase
VGKAGCKVNYVIKVSLQKKNMKYRKLGKTNFEVSEIALGTWQLGGKWGSEFSFENAEKILQTAVNEGVNFIDTADVYSAGLSENAIGKFLKNQTERIFVATKCGRQINPHIDQNYTPQILRNFVENSLKNMGLEVLDLIQLHCPPTETYNRPEIFGEFEKLKAEGKILNLGVSVEKISEALQAIDYENVTTVQIIFNCFRQRPTDVFFQEAMKRNVGVIVRVPLASGLLTGKYSKSTIFEPGDHRNFNRNGEAFDKGETFSGVDFDVALEAVENLKGAFPADENLAEIAMRWILDHEAVSTVIPGASHPSQVIENVKASNRKPLKSTDNEVIKLIYDQKIKPLVNHLW